MLNKLAASELVLNPDGSVYHLSPASNLPYVTDGYCYAGTEKFKLGFEPYDKTTADFKSDIEATAKFFQNIPYLWGGKSFFGVDCSGFTQLVYKVNNIKLPRDAYQQGEVGEVLSFVEESRPGDLAFFDNFEGRIIHVGIMLDEQKIIHASGKVRIDTLDSTGIFNKELNRHTHKLRFVRNVAGS